MTFFPLREIRRTYGIGASDVLSTVENELLPRLLQTVGKEVKKRGTEASSATPVLGVGSKVDDAARPSARRAEDDGDGDGNDDDDMDEEDATATKRKENRAEAESYGSDDEDDQIQERMAREASPMDDGEFDDDKSGPNPEADGSEEGEGEDSGKATGDAEDVEEVAGKDVGGKYLTRINTKHANIPHFQYNAPAEKSRPFTVDFTMEYSVKTPKLLMVNLVSEAVNRSVIQQVGCLRDCTFVPDEKFGGVETPVVHTAGVNLRAMWECSDDIDVNRIITNDIAAVLEEYGVEACRSNIIKELVDVFKAHNIAVDYRHLSLIADYMTRNGTFTPFNRLGLTGHVSPFTKMSFETTVSFLKDALVEGDWDDLSSPSSRIVMGKMGTVGTGAFDVLANAPTCNEDAAVMG